MSPVKKTEKISDEDLTPIVGKNLRRLRTKKGLSLERLSKASGVSRAMLSHIELSQSTPTINTLSKIARSLNVSFSALLQVDQPKPAIFLPLKESEVFLHADGKVKERALFPQSVLKSESVKFFELKLDGKSRKSSESHPQGTTVNLVLIRGSLEVKVGSQVQKLNAGDSIFFRSDISHSFLNPETYEAVAYKVVHYSDTSYE